MANPTNDGGPVAVQHLPAPDTVSPTPPKSPVDPKHSAHLRDTSDSNKAPLSTAGLATPLQPKSNKRPVPAEFDPPPLTGAAALADERRQREEQDRQNATKKSPNGAASAIAALRGGLNNNFSRPNDARSTTHSGAPSLIITSSPQVAEPTQMQTSPVSMSSAEENMPGRLTTSGGHVATVASPTSMDAPNSLRPSSDDHSNKAMTYPPSRSMDLQDVPREPPRNMSLPGFGSPRSMSTKKHKCPHCETDFTRHHNLKSHLLTHSQEKPFVCHSCEARFRRLHDLKRHTKLHTGEKPHICEICGRKFARGDALARHSKGHGNSTGRRLSMGGDGDDYDGDGNSAGDEMEGTSYHHDGSEGDNAAESGRRKSEPNRRAIQDALNHASSASNSHPRQSTTYPGSAVMNATRGSMYPPASHSNAGTSPRSGKHLSPRPSGNNISPHANSGPPPMYAQNSMIESPRPLSPGQHDPHRMSLDHQNYRSRSPHQQQYRGSGYGTPPTVLPPMTGAPQLPPLTGYAQDSRHAVPSQNSPSSIKTGSFPGIQHNSGSSHHSSGSSMREAMGSADVWDYIRSLESRFSRMQDDMTSKLKTQESHYEARISELQGELDSVKQGQAMHASQSQPQPPSR